MADKTQKDEPVRTDQVNPGENATKQEKGPALAEGELTTGTYFGSKDDLDRSLGDVRKGREKALKDAGPAFPSATGAVVLGTGIVHENDPAAQLEALRNDPVLRTGQQPALDPTPPESTREGQGPLAGPSDEVRLQGGAGEVRVTDPRTPPEAREYARTQGSERAVRDQAASAKKGG